MKIFYTHRTQGVGVEGVHIRGIVRAFRNLGYQVLIDSVHGCDPFRSNDQIKNRLHYASKWLHNFLATSLPEVLFEVVGLCYNVMILLRLGGKLLFSRPSFVYERYSLGTFAPLLLCKLFRIPIVMEVNESVVVERSRGLCLKRVHGALESYTLINATIVVTISDQFARRLIETYPYIRTKIIACPNGVSETDFDLINVSKTPSLRHQLSIRGKTLVGSVGQFVLWHGLEDFVTKISDIARTRDLGILFVGDGPVRQAVMDVARKHKIEDRVMFTGMVPHSAVWKYISLIDIAVIPRSNLHGSPMKLAEFMAAGILVMAPDLPPIRQVITDGINGYIFDGSIESLCSRLIEVLEDPESSRKVAERGRKYAAQHLTWEQNAKAVIKKLETTMLKSETK